MTRPLLMERPSAGMKRPTMTLASDVSSPPAAPARPLLARWVWLVAVPMLLAIAASGWSKLALTGHPVPGFLVERDGRVHGAAGAGGADVRDWLDRVVAVDGVPLHTGAELYAYVAARPPGTSFKIALERDVPLHDPAPVITTVHSRPRTLADFWVDDLGLLISALFYMAVGLGVWWWRPADAAAQAHLAYCLLYSVISAMLCALTGLLQWPPQAVVPMTACALGVAMLELGLVFPTPLGGRFQGRLRAAVLAAGALSAAAMAFTTALAPWRLPIQGLSLPWLLLGTTVLVANAAWSSLRKAASPVERAQAGWVLLGAFWAVYPNVLMAIATFAGLQVPFAALLSQTGPLMPIAVAIAIARHNLFDIDLLTRPTLVYTIVGSLLLGVYFVVAGAARALLGPAAGPDLLATAAVTVMFGPLRDRVKAWLDARFFRVAYDARAVMAGFTAAARARPSSEAIVAAFESAVDGALRPTHVRVHLAEAPPALPGELALPLHGDEGRLGTVVIGPKRSGLAFNKADRALLDTLAEHLALWLEMVGRLEREHRLEQEVADLKRAEAMHTEFLNLVSHELRTPVGAILGSVNLLNDYGYSDDAEGVLGKYHDRIYRNAQALSLLIDDLVHAGHLQAGRFSVLRTHADLGAIARGVHSELTALAAVKRQTLSCELPEQPPSAWGDPHRLAQVLRNLLHNAIKYTPKGGHVRLVLRPDGPHWRCEVADSGPGLTAEDTQRLFQRFGRLNNGASSKEQGLGLGLYIAKTLVEAHDGAIGVESAPGSGSTFWFTVPAAEV